MMEPRTIAVFRGTDDALAALRARAEELDMSRHTIDRLCGWKSGQAAKYLADPPIRGFSAESLIQMAAGLGSVLVLVEDEQSMQQIAKLGRQKRQQKAIRANGLAGMFNRRAASRIIRHFGRIGGLARNAQCDAAKRAKIASKGGKARSKSLTKEQRRELARHANVIRWDRVKAAVKP